MKTVNIHEAKTHLSKLIKEALQGEPFLIAKSGKSLVKVTMLEQEPPRRLGFLEGQFTVPDDFDTMFVDEIRDLFEGREEDQIEPGK